MTKDRVRSDRCFAVDILNVLDEQGALLLLLITELDSCYPCTQTLESAPVTVLPNTSTTATNKTVQRTTRGSNESSTVTIIRFHCTTVGGAT